MPKSIPTMSSRKFVRLLEEGGARFVRQRGTSHAIYERIVNLSNYELRITNYELKEACPPQIRIKKLERSEGKACTSLLVRTTF